MRDGECVRLLREANRLRLRAFELEDTPAARGFALLANAKMDELGRLAMDENLEILGEK